MWWGVCGGVCVVGCVWWGVCGGVYVVGCVWVGMCVGVCVGECFDNLVLNARPHVCGNTCGPGICSYQFER